MARLKALPALEVIRGFKGVIDFYLYRGLPCARAWPRFSRARQTTPMRASAALFGLIIRGYSLLGALHRTAFQEDAADQPRTARDIFVSAVLGHLHEASMSDFLTLLQESRDFLEQLTDLLHALHSIDTDELVVIVESSALPAEAATQATLATLATEAKLELLRLLLVSIAAEDFATQTTLTALLTELALKADLTETQPVSAAALPLPLGAGTAANQATMITALELIDDLRTALESVDTNAFQVRGRDQLFSFKELLHSQTVALVSGAGGYVQSPAVGAGAYWIVTTITARDTTRVTSKHVHANFHDGLSLPIHEQMQAFTVFDRSFWAGHTYLDVGDRIRVDFVGSQAGDTCVLNISGFIMTVET